MLQGSRVLVPVAQTTDSYTEGRGAGRMWIWPVIGEKGDQILAFNAGDKARLIMVKLGNKGENLRIISPAFIVRPGNRYIIKRPSRKARVSGEAILGKVLFTAPVSQR